MRIGYSTKVPSIFVTLIVLAAAGSLVALVYAWHKRKALDNILSKKISDMAIVTELEAALHRQKGLVTSYLIDKGNPKWLEELDQLEPLFRMDLQLVDKEIEDPKERAILAQISEAFSLYDAKREEVIVLFNQGKIDQAKELYLTEVNLLYHEVATRCNEIVMASKQDIRQVFLEGEKAVRRLTAFVMVTVVLTSLLALGLIWFLFSGIFAPVHRMAEHLRAFSGSARSIAGPGLQGDLEILRYYLRILMSEVEEARTDVEKSRGELHHNQQLAAIGSTVAYVAHEIRNRLVVIGGFARSIANRAGESELVKERSLEIYHEVGKLEDMLEDLMDLSRPIRLQTRVHSLNGIVKGVINILQEQLPENLSLEVCLAPDNPEVSVDKERLERVLLNLIRNAVEAMQDCGTLKVSTQTQGENALLVVEDNGPGIPKDIRDHIFDPFFTTKNKGTGLGLAICRQIVYGHGGTIQFESSDKNSTTFIVELPLC